MVPKGNSIRPTSMRVRESVFNRLCHGNDCIGYKNLIKDALILDGFCGTGSMAHEGLSRGAAFATCIDNNPNAIKCCQENSRALGTISEMKTIFADCLQPYPATEPCSLVFLDPPYFKGLVGPALKVLTGMGWIDANALCVIESGLRDPLNLQDDIHILDQRKCGKTLISFAKYLS